MPKRMTRTTMAVAASVAAAAAGEPSVTATHGRDRLCGADGTLAMASARAGGLGLVLVACLRQAGLLRACEAAKLTGRALSGSGGRSTPDARFSRRSNEALTAGRREPDRPGRR